MSSHWLLSIAFIRLGDTTYKGDVIKNMELINKTCNADCNPQYDYTWINNTVNKIALIKPLLSLDIPDRYDIDTYTCRSCNTHGVIDKICKITSYSHFGCTTVKISNTLVYSLK